MLTFSIQPLTTDGNGHHPISWGCGISADKLVRVKADPEWLIDTTQSEDTGGRRESVSRSNSWGERDVAERRIDVDGSMDKGCVWIVLGLIAKGFIMKVNRVISTLRLPTRKRVPAVEK